MDTIYTPDEQRQLLTTARATLEAVTQGVALPRLHLNDFSPALQAERACFVTLTYAHSGELRGCTGTLAARSPLILEVVNTTRQTALNDPRFYPVTPDEVPHLHIEISILTPMQPLAYTSPTDLMGKLRPTIDGVILQYHDRRATFLPQVWERVADPAAFLSMLCEKMGVDPDTWQQVHLEVYTYQSVVVEEPHL
ncbi:MAG: AmmeMemoRadiSam system protein A [Chloroflexi bacterium]|nr:AmmeMemoRadiSam system protein A [Chloroflexota bacterium]